MTTLPQLETDPPILVVHGGPGRASVASLRELWSFREVIGAFAVRQVLVKYKQAVVGIGWAVIQPVGTALVFALFLGRFAHLASEGVPYVLFALAGTTAWSYFAAATTNAMESVVRDSTLLRKVFFPREILPLTAVLAGLFDFLPTFLVLLVAAAVDGVGPSLTWLAVPLPLLLLVLTSLAIGLGVSGLNAYYRDVRYLVPFLIQLLMFASPVVYSLSVVPARWRTLYLALNPVATAIEDIRRTVIHHTWPAVGPNGAALGWSLLLLSGGYILFKRLERGFADRA